MNAQLLHREPEVSVEERVARLEADVAHIRSDVADIKIDLRKQSDRIDSLRDSLRAELHAVRDKLEDKIEALRVRLEDKLDELSQRLTRAMVWALVLYVTLAGTLLGVLAHGFGWL